MWAVRSSWWELVGTPEGQAWLRAFRTVQERRRREEGQRVPVRVVAQPKTCQCGCGEPVRHQRVFVDREHQRRWMTEGGAAEVVRRRWHQGKETLL
jgi:hypothetical protein